MQYVMRQANALLGLACTASSCSYFIFTREMSGIPCQESGPWHPGMRLPNKKIAIQWDINYSTANISYWQDKHVLVWSQMDWRCLSMHSQDIPLKNTFEISNQLHADRKRMVCHMELPNRRRSVQHFTCTQNTDIIPSVSWQEKHRGGVTTKGILHTLHSVPICWWGQSR